VNERNEEQRHEEVLNMATRDTTGTVGSSTGSGLGASRTGSTSPIPGSSIPFYHSTISLVTCTWVSNGIGRAVVENA